MGRFLNIIGFCAVCGAEVVCICYSCGCCENCCNNDVVCDAAMEETEPKLEGWEEGLHEAYQEGTLNV